MWFLAEISPTVQTSAFIVVCTGFASMLAWLMKAEIPRIHKTNTDTVTLLITSHEKTNEKLCEVVGKMGDSIDSLEKTTARLNGKLNVLAKLEDKQHAPQP